MTDLQVHEPPDHCFEVSRKQLPGIFDLVPPINEYPEHLVLFLGGPSGSSLNLREGSTHLCDDFLKPGYSFIRRPSHPIKDAILP